MKNSNKNFSKHMNEPIEDVKVDETVIEEVIQEVKKEVVSKIGLVSGCVELNIRRGPSKKSEVVTTVKEGSVLVLDEKKSTDEFFKVFTESGTEGYAMCNYVVIQ